jgi:hypothetical protein
MKGLMVAKERDQKKENKGKRADNILSIVVCQEMVFASCVRTAYRNQESRS